MLGQCVLVVVVMQFVANGAFFVFFIFFLSTSENYSLVLFVVGISTLVFILLILSFCSLPFCKSYILFFQFNPYYFDFFSRPFCKDFIGFDFILQSKFMVYSNLLLILLIFLSFY